MGGGINENGKEKKEKYFHYWRARKWGGHLSIFIFTVARLYYFIWAAINMNPKISSLLPPILFIFLSTSFYFPLRSY